MKKGTREVLYGVYNDDDILLDAVRVAKENNLDIMDVYTPFPVHGLDDALELDESKLHKAGFLFGASGALFGFLFMTWVFVRDWPIIFGGKPFWSVPAFIPVTFELTVLVAAIGMVTTFYTVSGLWPGADNVHLDERSTDDKFLIAFKTNDYSDAQKDALNSFFRETGAEEVNSKIV